jgi:hypothetical protein
MGDAPIRPSELKPSRRETRAICFAHRAIRAAARSEARRRGTKRFAQHRAVASSLEQPKAAARSDALPCDSERQDAPLSQASHAHGFSSESEGQLRSGCVVFALARAVHRSARLCSLAPHINDLRDVPRRGALSLLQKPLCHRGNQRNSLLG